MKFQLIPRSRVSPRIPLIGCPAGSPDVNDRMSEARRFQAMSEVLALVGERHPGGIVLERVGALSGLSESEANSALRHLLQARLVRVEGGELVGQTLSLDDSIDRADGLREP